MGEGGEGSQRHGKYGIDRLAILEHRCTNKTQKTSDIKYK